ncbi:MAG: tRNA 2-thiouridine(34) synthase MnmA [Anaerovoracaceae bacterium]
MNKSLDKNKVILGLSGGVDSATAALLLKDKGKEVIGLYFDVSGENEKGRREAEGLAKQLGIDFVYKNVKDEFTSIVIDNFCSEYTKGRTPNPCIVCNPNVKFKTLIEEANKQGAYYIATGHYAKTIFNEEDNNWYIKQAENDKKDQSYMMYRLGQHVISRLLLPLADLHDKEETRNIARENHLKNAETKDSQEICFIGDDEHYIDFIKEKKYRVKSGKFIDKNGKVLGDHKGLVNYTIGQRKGLGITFGKPVFVTRLDEVKNTVTLGDKEDLMSCQVICKGNFFTESDGENLPHHLENTKVYAKIRYSAKSAEATIKTIDSGRVESMFTLPQRAATPGQSIVFYLNNQVIGGGFIE